MKTINKINIENETIVYGKQIKIIHIVYHFKNGLSFFKFQVILNIFLFQGVRSSTINTCKHHNPCQNGGFCISTDNGPACDCKGIDYTGVFCEKGMSSNFFISFDTKNYS